MRLSQDLRYEHGSQSNNDGGDDLSKDLVGSVDTKVLRAEREQGPG